MRRATLPLGASVIALLLSACADTTQSSAPLHPGPAAHEITDDGDATLDLPLAGLTAAELDRFNRGRAVFSRVFTPGNGLGPSFNSAACANCHEEPSTGGIGDDLDEDVETHVSVMSGQTCDDLESAGGPVVQHHTTGLLQAEYPYMTSEPIPASAGTSVARRSTPAHFGFGLIDAIPSSAIEALADPNDANGDGVSGRVSRANGQVARFGRKATDATLLGFNAGAFQNEMGITSSVALAEQRLVGVPYPFDALVSPTSGAELSDDDLSLATDFVRFLRPAPRGKSTVQSNDGRELFSSIGCATCHVPSMRTGPSEVRALNNVKVEAFTDLLLHDMGTGLADICRGNALPSEFRTEPLMGLRFRNHYLHDARSATLDDAVLQHGGEAGRARDRFNGLTLNQRAALLAYLNTL
jgi:CxxC motif-containing protein (DUF1111 family)